MSEGKMVTERAAAVREREAWIEGVGWAHRNNYAAHTGAQFNHAGYIDQEAALMYPLPTVRRLREVKHYPGHGGLFGGALGVLYHYNPASAGFEWRYDSHFAPWAVADRLPADMVEALADLKANPWEEVSCE